MSFFSKFKSQSCCQSDQNALLGFYMAVLCHAAKTQPQNSHHYQAQKLEALGRLAGGVAHDFNNLLSIIDGYALMTLKNTKGDHQTLRYADRIHQAAKRGADLTRKLLTFGKHRIKTNTVIDLGQTVEEQEKTLHSLLPDTVSLTIQMQDDMPVHCSTETMSQILTPLIMNACDSIADCGSIMVDGVVCGGDELPPFIPSTECDNDYMCLTVMDTGTGIAPEILDKVFDPFFSTKEQGQGAGLGLSLVYGLVQQVGGYIDIHSSPGVGTAVRLYFPLSDQEPEVKKVTILSNDDISSIRFEGYSALVVDDEPDILHVVSDMLEELGMTVVSAPNGAEALIEQENFTGTIDFLLTDVMMPELNGVKLAELMAQLRPETKTVFMSGYPAGSSANHIQVPNDAVLLAKPVSLEKLATYLYRSLNVDEAEPQEHSSLPMHHWQETASM